MKAPFVSSVALASALIAAAAAFAQLPGMSQPKHFPWSDSKLSPDERADLVIKEMTIDEKVTLLHGAGMSFPDDPPESNGGAGFTRAIPRLGIPSIQMADSAYGVTRGAALRQPDLRVHERFTHHARSRTRCLIVQHRVFPPAANALRCPTHTSIRRCIAYDREP